jgi:hypothetical protein
MKCDCILVCILTCGKSRVNINVMIWNSYLKSGFFLVGYLSIRFFHDQVSVNQIFCVIEIQPVRCFGHEPLWNQGFQARSPATQVFPVLSCRSIRFFSSSKSNRSDIFPIEPLIRNISTLSRLQKIAYIHIMEKVESGGP